ncbi:MAG TPA: DNA-formamidopyrimidine glycosylase family protein [Candidatus Eisenbacteria bacterium]|nr:DNA-formamidopyrimidine glycosylase family protein [Candidatus Eisenbacteria bacterium]
MPELPFLEVLTENLGAGISGRRIESIQIRQPALLQTAISPDSFAGEFLSFPSRRGKYIVLECESRRAIVIHLMRLGRLQLLPPPGGGRKGSAANSKNISARILFDDGSALALVEHGTEKRARLWLTDDPDSIEELRTLGPDPTRGDMTVDEFIRAMRAESRQLKTFLTDQRAISGIGKGLSDEILFEARLSPLRLTRQVEDEDARRLYGAMNEVLARQTEKLRESVAGAIPSKEPSEHYAVHDHAGEPCPRCGTRIARISYADHETFYCPGCQTGGVPLKDRRLSKLLK